MDMYTCILYTHLLEVLISKLFFPVDKMEKKDCVTACVRQPESRDASVTTIWP